MKKFSLLIFILLLNFGFAQNKKAAIKSIFLKEYTEYFEDYNTISSTSRNYIDQFTIGEKFSREVITEEEPIVSYDEKLGYYSYLYILDDCSISVWIKNNIIFVKSFTLYNLNDYMSMIKRYNVLNLDYINEKGFDVGNDTFLQIEKDRYEKYDGYHFYFLGSEYFMLNDLNKTLKSK